MTIQEKILLVQCILWDIRLDFADEDNPIGRAEKAMELCAELCLELESNIKWHFHTLAERCLEYIEDYEVCGDGRFFREDFPDGYCEMENLHGLPMTRDDKSDEFKKIFDEYTYQPHYYMKDCEELV